MKEVRKVANRLKACRVQEQIEEAALRSALDKDLSDGKAVGLAASLCVSPQHLSDVRHGKRGISSELLEKLCEVGG
jgi:hypothetical protein